MRERERRQGGGRESGLSSFYGPDSAGHSPVGVARLSQAGAGAPLLSLCNWLSLSSPLLSYLSRAAVPLRPQHHCEAALQSDGSGESDRQASAVSSELSTVSYCELL